MSTVAGNNWGYFFKIWCQFEPTTPWNDPQNHPSRFEKSPRRQDEGPGLIITIDKLQNLVLSLERISDYFPKSLTKNYERTRSTLPKPRKGAPNTGGFAANVAYRFLEFLDGWNAVSHSCSWGLCKGIGNSLQRQYRFYPTSFGWSSQSRVQYYGSFLWNISEIIPNSLKQRRNNEK